jgi:Tfp pilus assembly protein FimT
VHAPEFGSASTALMILLAAPGFAYLIARKRK